MPQSDEEFRVSVASSRDKEAEGIFLFYFRPCNFRCMSLILVSALHCRFPISCMVAFVIFICSAF